MVFIHSNYPSDSSSAASTGEICAIVDSAVSLDQTVNQIIKSTGISPGTIQEMAAVVPYLTVKENFDLFVSKAQPQNGKVDLLVDDTLSEMELPVSVTNQPFDSLSTSLSFQLQWVLNQLCQRNILVISRWLWTLPDEERKNWLQLFRSSIRQSHLIIFILADEDVDLSFVDRDIQNLEDLAKFLQKNKEQ